MKPDVLKHPKFDQLATRIDMMIQAAESSGRWNEDNIHYMWEHLMTTLYGPEFFKSYFNKRFA